MLRGAEKRLHIVDGLAIAQQNMDNVVSTIRTASDSANAGEKLQSDFGLSSEQVNIPFCPCPGNDIYSIASVLCKRSREFVTRSCKIQGCINLHEVNMLHDKIGYVK